MVRFFRAMFDANDTSVDVCDVAGITIISAHLAMAMTSLLRGNPVDLQGFGVGGAALVAAISGAGWMRGKQRALDARNAEMKKEA